MPEILDMPDLGVGEDVGIGVVYFHTGAGKPKSLQPPAHIISPPKPTIPTWSELWAMFKARVKLDLARLKERIWRSKH